MKEVIKSIKENPREFVETVVLMSTLSILFYVSMWVFY
jgi:hypothetical protein